MRVLTVSVPLSLFLHLCLLPFSPHGVYLSLLLLGEILCSIVCADDEDILSCATSSAKGFQKWKEMNDSWRHKVLLRYRRKVLLRYRRKVLLRYRRKVVLRYLTFYSSHTLITCL